MLLAMDIAADAGVVMVTYVSQPYPEWNTKGLFPWHGADRGVAWRLSEA